MNNTTTPWWRNRSNLPFIVFLAIAGFFLWTEHRVHVIEYLPWILVLGCLFMHIFMHGGHGGGHDHGGGRDTESRDDDDGDSSGPGTQANKN